MLGIQNTSNSTQKIKEKIHRMIAKGDPRTIVVSVSNYLVWSKRVKRFRKNVSKKKK